MSPDLGRISRIVNIDRRIAGAHCCLERRAVYQRDAGPGWLFFRKGAPMIFGLTTFTLIHVVLSLVGIFAGLVAGRRLDGWTGVFLVTTVATSVTGFGFPFVAFLPSHAVGIISLVVLAAVIVARYVKHITGAWRGIYVGGTVLALYLNVFVLLVQLFRRLPALIVAAPKQQEPPFLVTQLVVLALFVWLGRAAVKGFRAEPGGIG